MVNITREEYLATNKRVYRFAKECGIRCRQRFPSISKGRRVCRIKFWIVDDEGEGFPLMLAYFEHLLKDVPHFKEMTYGTSSYWACQDGTANDIIIYFN